MASKTIKEAKIKFEIGYEAYRSQYYEKAVGYLEEAAKVLADKFSYFYLAECYKYLKDHYKALNAYKEAYKRLDNSKANMERIIILKCMGLMEEHIGNFENSIDNFNSILFMLKDFGVSLRIREMKKEIKEEKKKIEDLFKMPHWKDYVLAFNQGEELRKNGYYDTAIELYSKCLKFKETADCYYYKAQCYRLLNKYKEAIKAYDQCLKFKTDTLTDSIEINALFHSGMCYFNMEDFNNAAIRLKRALKNTSQENIARKTIEEHYAQANGRIRVIWC